MLFRFFDLLKRSARWRAVEKKFLAANPACAACGATKRLEVHHILPVHLWPALELITSNMMTLCRAHHFEIGHFRNWKKYNPSAREDAFAYSKRAVSSGK